MNVVEREVKGFEGRQVDRRASRNERTLPGLL
jgi:hypothetical protein